MGLITVMVHQQRMIEKNEKSEISESGAPSGPSAWLEELTKCCRVIESINSELALLESKRVTLEEKMIKQYLHDLAIQHSTVIGDLHSLLSNKRGELLKDEWLEDLRQLNVEMLLSLGELLKATRYDLNYLEQYFEYDYYQRLQNESKFLERIQNLGKLVKALVHVRA